MLTLDAISNNYPINLRPFRRNIGELKKRLTAFCRGLDFAALAKEVEPFLFSPNDNKRILAFPEFIKSAKL